jgi:hypothetical protein
MIRVEFLRADIRYMEGRLPAGTMSVACWGPRRFRQPLHFLLSQWPVANQKQQQKTFLILLDF